MKNLEILKFNIIAHRGYYNNKDIPENSLKSFKNALKYNYIIEFDIHLLKDNNIVVFHDDNLKRLTGINKNLKDLTYDDIKDITLLETKEKIPLFKDVLRLINGSVPIIVEFKSDRKVGLLEKEAMKLLKDYKGFYAIKSFHPGIVYYFKRHYPEVIRGQLSYDFADAKTNKFGKYVMRNMFFNFLTKPDFVSYGTSTLPIKKLNKWKKKFFILGWTIKNKKDYDNYSKLFDNVICENMEDFTPQKNLP